MSTVQTSMPVQSAGADTPSLWSRIRTNRNWMALWFMLPAAAFLILLLAYPLGLGVWMSFTDERIGRGGVFVGLENYQWLWDDSIFWLSVFNTLLYTVVASAIKFAIGLYLALLLNRHMPFKAMIRSIVLIPFIVPTVLSAIAFWWIYDSQFSIISWSLIKLGLIDHNINFLGDANMARGSVIFANIWRGVPFVAITLLAGLQTVSPSLYEAATLDGATNWQRFRFITYPLLTPIIAVVMTFSVLFTFTDFQLIWALTRGGPLNATHLMATLSYQRGIISGRLGEGAAIATAMIPFLAAAIAISWFGMPRRKWQQGSHNDCFNVAIETAGFRRGRQRRHELSGVVAAPRGDALSAAVRDPDRAAVPVLLDGSDIHQAGRTADRHGEVQPVLGDPSDHQAHQQAVVRDAVSALALEHDVCRGRRHRAVDLCQHSGGLCHRAPAVQGRRHRRRDDLLFLSGAPLDPVHSAGVRDPGLWPVRLAAVAHSGLSHAADSVLDLALDGVLQDHSL